jgi:hypothetical protein
MVVHVQEGDLAPGFAEDEENCIKELKVLLDVVQPHAPRTPLSVRGRQLK